jgi:hypothetical protein
LKGPIRKGEGEGGEREAMKIRKQGKERYMYKSVYT